MYKIYSSSCVNQKSTTSTQPKVTGSDKASGQAGLKGAGSQDNYDAPWDWKVKKMGKDFDNNCQVVNQDKEMNTNHLPRCIPDPFTVSEKSSDEVESAEPAIRGYEVDPTIPLENQG